MSRLPPSSGPPLLAAVALLTVMAGSMSGCAGGGSTQSAPAPPDWYLTPEAAYSDEAYLTAAASAPSAQAAQNQAFGNLARVFEADIEARQTLKDEYQEVKRDGRVTNTQRDTRLLTRADVGARQKLLNAEVLEQQKVEGTFYALVGMERRETIRIYGQEIDRNRHAIEAYRTTAGAADNPVTRLAVLQKALVLATVNERLVTQRSIVAGGGAPPASASPVTTLEKAVREAQAQCPVVVRTGDGEGGAAIVDQVGATLTQAGFRVVDRPAEAHLEARVRYDEQPTLESREDEFLRWTLAIDLIDRTRRQTLETFTAERRAGALSLEAVKRQARSGARRAIENEFAPFLDRTLLGIDPS